MNKDLEIFWRSKFNLVSWFKEPKIILNFNKKKKRHEWYKDGKINIYYNCIEKNLSTMGDKIAIKYLDKNNNLNELTYNQLSLLVESFSILLKKKNFYNNSKIVIHASASIESSVAMLACCKLGLKFTVIFQTLPSDSIMTRLKIFKPDLFITRCDIKEVKNTILPLVNKFNKKKNRKIKILHFNDKIKIPGCITFNLKKKTSITKIIKTKKLNSEKSSFVLFTSGSTGDPKGVEHSTGGYLLYTKFTCIEQFGMDKNSIVLTLSDAGWINGHSYALFGPLSLGATTFLIEDPMMVLNSNLLIKILKDHNISILYLPVTIIRLLKAIMANKSLTLPNLKCIGSMGEPLASNIANWYTRIFSKNKLSVVNTYFQTETGGIICSPKFNENYPLLYSGTVGKSVAKFIKLNIFEKKNNLNHELKIITPWPGCMKNIINGKKIYEKYFDKNNNFKLFDIGRLDKNKNLLVLGRSDDVMNVRGHRIGSGEIENQILKLNQVKEVCAVSCNDKMEGEKIAIFFSKKKKNENDISNEIGQKLVYFFGSWAFPKFIIELSQLPKTRSGKILRRILRVLLNDSKQNIGDISTILDKKIIEEIRIKVGKCRL